MMFLETGEAYMKFNCQDLVAEERSDRYNWLPVNVPGKTKDSLTHRQIQMGNESVGF